mgnify:CR=1 FL=1
MMLSDLIAFLWQPALQSIYVILAVLLLDRYWVLPGHLNPWVMWRFIGIQMAKKVCNDGHDHAQQQIIAGGLSILVLVIPSTTLFYLLYQFAYYPIFFDAILLFFSLTMSGHLAQYKKCAKALRFNRRRLAKDMLAKMVLRDTKALSNIGISKAAIESLILRFQYQQIVSIFWFILAGPFAAFTYRSCFELYQVWNPKIRRYKEFSRVTQAIVYAFQWLPIRLGSLLALLGMQGIWMFSRLSLKGLLSGLICNNGHLILGINSQALRLHLSGAVMYEGIKYRRSKFFGQREPILSDIHKPLDLIRRSLWLFVALMLPISILLDARLNSLLSGL